MNRRAQRHPGVRSHSCGAFAASLATVTGLLAAPAARADCFDDAVVFHKVNPWILRAIAARESNFNPMAIAHNSNNTYDIGLFGTNSVHLPELARYGITKLDLLDGCKSVYVAGWRLSKMVRKYGNTWKAVGAYNSETPSYRDRYASAIQTIVNFWIEQDVLSRQ